MLRLSLAVSSRGTGGLCRLRVAASTTAPPLASLLADHAGGKPGSASPSAMARCWHRSGGQIAALDPALDPAGHRLHSRSRRRQRGSQPGGALGCYHGHGACQAGRGPWRLQAGVVRAGPRRGRTAGVVVVVVVGSELSSPSPSPRGHFKSRGPSRARLCGWIGRHSTSLHQPYSQRDPRGQPA